MNRRLTVLALAALAFLVGCGGTPAPRAVDPQPGRPYSPAMVTTDFYFFSGKIGVTQETRAMQSGRTAAETRNILESFRELFEDLGTHYGNVVQATVYLTDLDDYQAMNEVWVEYFPDNAPARETVVVADLVADARIEISFIGLRR